MIGSKLRGNQEDQGLLQQERVSNRRRGRSNKGEVPKIAGGMTEINKRSRRLGRKIVDLSRTLGCIRESPPKLDLKKELGAKGALAGGRKVLCRGELASETNVEP